MSGPFASRWWAPTAWVDGRWQDAVLLEAGADGRWRAVTAGVVQPPADAERLAGAALPGLVDAHGHAFQRAFAGLAERRESAHDDFWSWRDRMYGVALRIAPAQLHAVAAQLCVELLAGGYTQLCEFHYLQHAPDGAPYDDPLATAWALADAAADAGIGLTLLPVLYERAGFDRAGLRDDQRRFRLDADGVHAACARIRAARRPGVDAGLAIHSLRAAAPASIHRLRRLAEHDDGPIHVHVAEQVREVEDCVAATGVRPVAWLAREGMLDARWQLVHATHVTAHEIGAVAASGAGVVLCPTTEANLGDGLTDLPGWLAAGVPLSIGSDSHVGRDWREELRLLEYGQRLSLRARCVGADPAGAPSTSERLWQRVQAGGALAAGWAVHGLRAGARADLLVADPADPALAGVPGAARLDAIVFSAPARPWRDVIVAGRRVIRDGRHPAAETIAARFADAMASLHAPG